MFQTHSKKLRSRDYICNLILLCPVLHRSTAGGHRGVGGAGGNCCRQCITMCGPDSRRERIIRNPIAIKQSTIKS